jgi:hypothetical protein
MGRRYSLRGTHIAARSGTRAHQGDGGGPFIWLTQRRQAAKPPLRIANHPGPEGRLYGYNASKSDGYSRRKMDRLTSSCTWQLCIHSDPRWYFVGTKSAYSWPPSFFSSFNRYVRCCACAWVGVGADAGAGTGTSQLNRWTDHLQQVQQVQQV